MDNVRAHTSEHKTGILLDTLDVHNDNRTHLTMNSADDTKASTNSSTEKESITWAGMALQCFLLLTTVPYLVIGQELGPSYKVTQYCTQDSDCSQLSGEICWWSYDGCKKGKCMCHPNTHFLDSSGTCKQLIMGGGKCRTTDNCRDGMSCISGRCLCTKGILTDDNLYCIQSHERLLGQPCDPGINPCYQLNSMSGLTGSEVECSNHKCRCIAGFKDDDGRCRRWNVLEEGCSEDHHCQGGALCISSKCQCPHHFKPVAGNTKCARIGAITDLALKQTCDEFHQQRYCASGLVCHQCAGQSQSICVKFLEATPGKLVSSSNRPSASKTIYIVCSLVLIMIISTRGQS